MTESMQQFWESYSDRYMASDLDAVEALYEAPFLAVRENEPIHLRDREEVRGHLAGLMEAYRNIRQPDGWRTLSYTCRSD